MRADFFKLVGVSSLLVALLIGADRIALPDRGRVLLLQNRSVLEGTVERAGDQYRIRQGKSEMQVPVQLVLFVGNDLAGAYEFLKTRIDPKKAEDHLDLAQWCRRHGLKAESAAETDAALALNPAKKVSGEEPRATSNGDHSPLVVRQFSSKVQPILMNLCAGCHGTGSGGVFVLHRIGPSNSGSPQATQTNLDATVRQLNRENPPASPLLLKAVSKHGSSALPPIRERQAAAFKTLDDWVKSVCEVGTKPKENPPGLNDR